MSEVKELLTNAERPAYPTNGRMHSEMVGLSKREMFVMAAMQGIIANRELQRDMLKDGGQGFYPKHIRNLNEIVSFEAISIADELLKQLES